MPLSNYTKLRTREGEELKKNCELNDEKYWVVHEFVWVFMFLSVTEIGVYTMHICMCELLK